MAIKVEDAIANLKYQMLRFEKGTEPDLALQMAIKALEEKTKFNEIMHELSEYQAIGTVEELQEAKMQYNNIHSIAEKTALMGLSDYGTAKEALITEMKRSLDCLLKEYQSIGTIEEFKTLKMNKTVLPIATINFSKADMQKIVDEKIAQIELDIQEIRAKAIDEFAELLKYSLANNYRHLLEKDTDGFDWITTDAVETHIDEIAEQMKAGDK